MKFLQPRRRRRRRRRSRRVVIIIIIGETLDEIFNARSRGN
jgi:hypothetical protein